MTSNDPATIRAAILAGTIQQVQSEPSKQAQPRSAVLRGALAGGSSGTLHRRLY